jgi:hypothetical protein
MSSRSRSAETSRAFGGVITATGEPLRATSISSPEVARNFSNVLNRVAAASSPSRVEIIEKPSA